MLTLCKFFQEFLDNTKYCLVLGAGGVSMSSLALVFQNAGYMVKGYDISRGIYTELLEKKGISISYREEDVNFDDVGLVVYTGAISSDSYLIREADRRGIKCLGRSVALGMLMREKKCRIGIAGTHGKSSTTGMLSHVFFAEENKDPTIMIGADLPAIDGCLKIGGGDEFIFEACEYKDSFLDFYPTVALVLNAEHDHADYFKTHEQMKRSFARYMSIATDAGGIAVVNFDNQSALESASMCEGKKIFFSSLSDSVDVYAQNITLKSAFANFDIYAENKFLCNVTLNVPGRFQVDNALAAAAASYFSGISPNAIKEGLESFKGVKRRFEFRKKYNGAVIIDDYAHHPDEITATLAVANQMGFKRVRVAYQPHTYTRTKEFFDGFVKAFELCDEVVFADIYSAREADIYGVNSKMLADATVNGKYLGGFEKISEYYKNSLQDGDVLIIMGAGDIIKLEI